MAWGKRREGGERRRTLVSTAMDLGVGMTTSPGGDMGASVRRRRVRAEGVRRLLIRVSWRVGGDSIASAVGASRSWGG